MSIKISVVTVCYNAGPVIEATIKSVLSQNYPDMEYITRQALHSFRLAFRHPVTGESMMFEAPLPEDMRSVLEERENV